MGQAAFGWRLLTIGQSGARVLRCALVVGLLPVLSLLQGGLRPEPCKRRTGVVASESCKQSLSWPSGWCQQLVPALAAAHDAQPAPSRADAPFALLVCRFPLARSSLTLHSSRQPCPRALLEVRPPPLPLCASSRSALALEGSLAASAAPFRWPQEGQAPDRRVPSRPVLSLPAAEAAPCCPARRPGQSKGRSGVPRAAPPLAAAGGESCRTPPPSSRLLQSTQAPVRRPTIFAGVLAGGEAFFSQPAAWPPAAPPPQHPSSSTAEWRPQAPSPTANRLFAAPLSVCSGGRLRLLGAARQGEPEAGPGAAHHQQGTRAGCGRARERWETGRGARLTALPALARSADGPCLRSPARLPQEWQAAEADHLRRMNFESKRVACCACCACSACAACSACSACAACSACSCLRCLRCGAGCRLAGCRAMAAASWPPNPPNPPPDCSPAKFAWLNPFRRGSTIKT